MSCYKCDSDKDVFIFGIEKIGGEYYKEFYCDNCKAIFAERLEKRQIHQKIICGKQLQ